MALAGNLMGVDKIITAYIPTGVQKKISSLEELYWINMGIILAQL